MLGALSSAGSALGGTFEAWGPRDFVRSTGQPIVEVATFDVIDAEARYEVRVESETVSSARIVLNGSEIFGPNDFNQTVSSLVRAVPLLERNEISVELNGKPGERLQLTVIGYDDVVPVITAEATPIANVEGWNSSDVTVSFDCADATSGIAYCPADILVIEEGEAQLISGVARDLASNAASASVIVSLDKTVPVIEVSAPANGSSVATREVEVSGTAVDEVSGLKSVRCDGVAATLTGDEFACTVELAEGPNRVLVEAIDHAGHTSSSTLELNGQAPPKVRITEPENMSFRNLSSVTVRGTVSDSAATVRVNGVVAAVGSGSFTATVPLVEGNNTLTAVARSASGKVGTGSVQVTLDTTPPRIAVTTPLEGTQTVEEAIAIGGSVNDLVVGTVNGEQAEVRVNGVVAEVSNRTFLAPAIPLAIGENTIQIVARDRVGNSNTARLRVTRVDPARPVIRVVRGSGQVGTIGQLLPESLTVRLTDAEGAPVVGEPVVFKVTAANGALDTTAGLAPWAAVTTDQNGEASVSYRLGTRAGAGNNRVEATATGFEGTAVFVASADPQVATRINVDSGQNQSGATGEALAFPFVVVVTDDGHNRLADVPVVFEVIEGGGTFASGEGTSTTRTDGDGRALAILTLGDQPGFDNNLVHARVPGLSGNPAAFTASARRPGNEGDTRISGVVLDNSNDPLPGATIRLYQAYLGSNSNIPVPVATPVVTNEQGRFVMSGVPVGAFKLVADGTTIPGSREYPTLEFDIVTVAGQETTVGLPIYLPVLDSVNRLCVDETTGGILTLPSVPGFSLDVEAGSATFPGGSRSGCVTVTPVHGDKVPMVPGFGQQPRFVVTIQPAGTHFSPPARLTLPNVDGLQPREVTEMYSYDHDLSAFVAIGTGTVSDDGSVLRSDPGVGVIKAGWHCGGNPNATGSAATCPECKKCDSGNCIPKPGPCDDEDKCTEDDRCENGACVGTPVDLSGVIPDSTFGGSVSLPNGLVDKANSAIQRIPGLGGVTFKEAQVGASGSAKHCCDKDKGKIEYGIKEGEVEVSLSADLFGLTLWGPPTISRVLDFQVVVAEVDLELGVKFSGKVSLKAKGGMRKDDCKEETCGFGSVGGSAGIGLKATADAIGCIETWGTDKVCGGLTITPAAISTSVSGSVGYNLRDCNSGFDGKFSLGKVVFKAEFSPGIPNVGSLTYEYTIFNGGSYP